MDLLKEERENKGLTVSDIACKLGVTESAVRRWENHIAHPTVLNFLQYADLVSADLNAVTYTHQKLQQFATNKSIKDTAIARLVSAVQNLSSLGVCKINCVIHHRLFDTPLVV